MQEKEVEECTGYPFSGVGDVNGVAELPLLLCQRKTYRLVESLSVLNLTGINVKGLKSYRLSET